MKPSSIDAALQLADAVRGRDSGRLRQLADRGEIIRVERAHAIDQIVADLGPIQAGGRSADVVGHRGGARREDCQVGTALALEFKLRVFEAVADLIVTDFKSGSGGRLRGVVRSSDLALAVTLQFARSGGVVSVAIDNHGWLTSLAIQRFYLKGVGLRAAWEINQDTKGCSAESLITWRRTAPGSSSTG